MSWSPCSAAAQDYRAFVTEFLERGGQVMAKFDITAAFQARSTAGNVSKLDTSREVHRVHQPGQTGG